MRDRRQPRDFEERRPMTTGQTIVVGVCLMIIVLWASAALFEALWQAAAVSP
jgi:hypothetical protein